MNIFSKNIENPERIRDIISDIEFINKNFSVNSYKILENNKKISQNLEFFGFPFNQILEFQIKNSKLILHAELKGRFPSLLIRELYKKRIEQFLHQIYAISKLTEGLDWDECRKNNSLTIMFEGEKITFRDFDIQQITEIFYEEQYSFLTNSKCVIDIGASVGDTAIYFIKKGVEKVIAVEPFVFDHLKNNIEINNYTKQIIPIQASCPETSLKEIIDMHNIVDVTPLALKIDCEGCEYSTIENTPNNVLRKFAYIMLEYHDGKRNLITKFVQNDFSTKLHVIKKMPKLMKFFIKKNTELGYIYAQQNSKKNN